MQAYKIVTNINESAALWLKKLPISKDKMVEIIVIDAKETESTKKQAFSTKDINELSEAISLPIDPLKFQKNIRNEW